MTDLVTLGEAMAVVRSITPGPPRPASAAQLSYAGAEATVAIGVRRLGHTARWIGRLGADDFGEMIVAGLRAEGVDIDPVRTDPDRPTGLLVRHQRTADRARVAYYRHGGAGVALDSDDLPVAAVRQARILHLTGITPAMGPGPARAVDTAVDLARRAGVHISFDVNHRGRLWPAARARPVLRRLVAAAGTVFAGVEEAATVLDMPPDTGPELLAHHLAELGPAEVVVKLGAAGALALRSGGVTHVPARRATAVDAVGAGDAFAAGYLSGVLDGLPVPERLARAVTCGAYAVSTVGDWEGLPLRRELGLIDDADVLR